MALIGIHTEKLYLMHFNAKSGLFRGFFLFSYANGKVTNILGKQHFIIFLSNRFIILLKQFTWKHPKAL